MHTARAADDRHPSDFPIWSLFSLHFLFEFFLLYFFFQLVVVVGQFHIYGRIIKTKFSVNDVISNGR